MPQIFILLFFALAAYGQVQQRVAVINTLDDGDPPIKVLELTYLTDKLRETASNVLPKEQYGVMTTESIVAFFGSHEKLVKVCNESSCLVELGRKVSADYVSQAMIGRFGKDLTIRTELYDTRSGTLVGSFTGYSNDIYGLLTLIDEKAPDLFKKLLSSPSSPSTPPPAVAFSKTPQQEKEPEVAQEEEDYPYEPSSDRKKLDKTKPSLLSLDLPERLQLGFRTGINFSTICKGELYEIAGTDYDPCSDNSSLGMQLGFVLDIAVLEWLRIQPGLMYSQIGTTGYYFMGHKINQKTHHYLEIPLLLSLKFSALRLNAGPYFGVPIAGDGDYIGDFSASIGFDIGMFYIDTFYHKEERTYGLNVGVNL